MEPNRIKDILKKIEAGEEPLMPTIRKPEPERAAQTPVAPSIADAKIPKWKISLLALIVFLLLSGAGYGGYLIYKNYRMITGDAPENVIAALSRLTDLPAGEAPTVSTLTDLESVKDQPFFRDAELGDKVVVYNKAGKAYIYRPTTGKLIGIAPLTQ